MNFKGIIAENDLKSKPDETAKYMRVIYECPFMASKPKPRVGLLSRGKA